MAETDTPAVPQRFTTIDAADVQRVLEKHGAISCTKAGKNYVIGWDEDVSGLHAWSEPVADVQPVASFGDIEDGAAEEISEWLNRMTDTPEVNDIPTILARANAATEGIWRAYDEHGVEAEVRSIENGQSFRMARLDGWENNMANAEFIAHSRTDVPSMAKEILSLRAQRSAWKRLAMEYARYLTGGQITAATEAAGGQAFVCDAELSRREKGNG